MLTVAEHSTLNILETVRDRDAWFQRTTTTNSHVINDAIVRENVRNTAKKRKKSRLFGF